MIRHEGRVFTLRYDGYTTLLALDDGCYAKTDGLSEADIKELVASLTKALKERKAMR